MEQLELPFDTCYQGCSHWNEAYRAQELKSDTPYTVRKEMAAQRKAQPVFSGPLQYFPDALLAVAEVCRIGGEQHAPGEPMRWIRDKSPDQLDAAVRHLIDHGRGTARDTDGGLHLAKAAWRVLAELQLTIERAACESQ